MSTQLMICLVIFFLTCAGYLAGIRSLATIAMTSLVLLSFTGCLTAKDALACFSDGTVIMIGAMSVIAAGFNRTRFCTGLAAGISRLARGSAPLVLLLYCLLTMLLSQMVQSPVIVFGIVVPLCMASVDSMGLSRSGFALSLGVVSISTCSAMPIGAGATQAAELSSYISTYYGGLAGFSGTVPVVGFLDPILARLPMLIFSVVYCAFVMPRFTPDRFSVRTAAGEIRAGGEQPPLPVFSEFAGIVIFFGSALMLMLQAVVFRSVAVWQICLAGAALMVLCGVLRPEEAARSIPVSMLLLIVGALAMSRALSDTGAGELIGGLIAGLVANIRSNYIIGFFFFFFPFVLAQFMSNRGAMLIFFPIAIAACHQIGGDPRGLMLLIESGALTAFMTPMPTTAVPCIMEYGGYSQQDLLRGGWLYAVLACVLSVGWIMTVMPVL